MPYTSTYFSPWKLRLFWMDWIWVISIRLRGCWRISAAYMKHPRRILQFWLRAVRMQLVCFSRKRQKERDFWSLWRLETTFRPVCLLKAVTTQTSDASLHRSLYGHLSCRRIVLVIKWFSHIFKVTWGDLISYFQLMLSNLRCPPILNHSDNLIL